MMGRAAGYSVIMGYVILLSLRLVPRGTNAGVAVWALVAVMETAILWAFTRERLRVNRVRRAGLRQEDLA
jgi:hypothetical protein